MPFAKLSLPRTPQVHVLYGFPTVGKTTLQKKIAENMLGRKNYLTGTEMRYDLTDTDDWLGRVNVNHLPDPADRLEHKRLIAESLTFAAGKPTRVGTVSIIFTNYKVIVPESTFVGLFYPVTKDVMLSHLYERELTAESLAPIFSRWYDDLLASDFFKYWHERGRAFPVETYLSECFDLYT